MGREPNWLTAGYAPDDYEAMCEDCEHIVCVPVDRESLRSLKTDAERIEIAEFLFQFAVMKLYRECDCSDNSKRPVGAPRN